MKHFFIFVNILFCASTTFQTAIGPCYLTSDLDQIYFEEEVKDLVVKHSKILLTTYKMKNPQSVYIHLSHSSDNFNKRVGRKMPQWVAGIAMGKNKVVVKSPHFFNISFSQMKKVLVHELNHIYINRIDKKRTAPSWFKEGLAMSSADEFTLRDRIRISKARLTGSLLHLHELNRFFRLPRNQVDLAYSQSAAAVYFLIDRHGQSSIQSILLKLENGYSFEDAFVGTTDQNLIDFSKDYTRYLKSAYMWLVLIEFPNLIFILFPVLLTCAFILRHYRNKKILKKWEIEEELYEKDDEYWQES